MKHGTKRLGLVLAAGLIVVLSNLAALYQAGQNRVAASSGTIELTERELALVPVIGDSTVMSLELNWTVQSDDRGIRNSPGWFTAARLTELGFDCRLPTTDPGARDFYRSMLPMPVCVVLERQTAKTRDVSNGRTEKGLVAIDVGLDAGKLRNKYSDIARFVVARGVVSLVFDDRPDSEVASGRPPRIRGRINQIVPNLIFVPRPHSEALLKLRDRSDRREDSDNREPRYAVTVSWGTHGEPWVRSVRMLPAAVPSRP